MTVSTTASAWTVFTEDRIRTPHRPRTWISARSGCSEPLAPRSDRDQRNTCGLEHEPRWRVARHGCVTVLEGPPRGPEPFRRLDAELEHQAGRRTGRTLEAPRWPSAMCTHQGRPGLSPSGSARTSRQRGRRRRIAVLASSRQADRRAPRGRGGEAAASPRPRRAPTRNQSGRSSVESAAIASLVPSADGVCLGRGQQPDASARVPEIDRDVVGQPEVPGGDRDGRFGRGLAVARAPIEGWTRRGPRSRQARGPGHRPTLDQPAPSARNARRR